MWRYRDGYLVNEAQGKVLGLQDEYGELNKLFMSEDKKDGVLKQLYDVIYVDEYPDEPKKGELNEDFGLYVERDFYIVSALSAHRYLDLIGRNMHIKIQNGRKSQ